MIDLKILLTITTLSGCFGIALSDFLTEIYGKIFKKQLGKPLGCSFCMAFWGGFSYSISLGYGIIDSALIGCASSIVSTLISKFINI